MTPAAPVGRPCPCPRCATSPVLAHLSRRYFGEPGPPIRITSGPRGRRACVLDPDWRLIEGYLAAPDCPVLQSEVFTTGPEIRFRTVNPNGDVVFDADGKQGLEQREGGGYGLARLVEGCRTEVRFVVAAATAVRRPTA